MLRLRLAVRRMALIGSGTCGGLAVATSVASSAHAAPPPSTVDPCSLLLGPAASACHHAQSIAAGASNAASVAMDPLGAIAKACSDAAAWLIEQFAVAVNATTQVDLTNPAFVRRYAVVFGACTFLTLILWLLGVLKRAIAGVPLGQALGEAVGLLWLSVLACAFTPAVLALVVKLTDDLTAALLAGTGADTDNFLTDFAKSIPAVGGGPIVVVLVSMLALAAAVILWLELLIRAGMLYVGALLGCAVYSGLVDRSLWRHVRRWVGLMVAVVLAKPVIAIVLSLATALVAHPTNPPAAAASGSGDAGSSGMVTSSSVSSLLAGLAVMFLAIFASMMIYRFVPSFGDDMSALHQSRRTAQSSGPAAAVNGPATYVRQGISTHAYRPTGGSAATSAATARTGAVGSGSVAAAGPAAAGVVLAGTGARAATAPARQGVANADAMSRPAAATPPPPPLSPPSPSAGRPPVPRRAPEPAPAGGTP
jgi:hypothetical protein